MIIYVTPVSSFSLRVRAAAAYKGITVRFEAPPNGYRSEDYRRIVPTGTVPALVRDGFVLAESDAIIEYLDETEPGPALMPRDPMRRAATRMLSRLHDFRVEPPLRALMPQLPPGNRNIAAVRRSFEAIHDGLATLTRMARPNPFLAGPEPSLSDFAILATAIMLPRMASVLESSYQEPSWLPEWDRAFRAFPALRDLCEAYEDAIDRWVAQRISVT